MKHGVRSKEWGDKGASLTPVGSSGPTGQASLTFPTHREPMFFTENSLEQKSVEMRPALAFY
jgi:hypothetical protein